MRFISGLNFTSEVEWILNQTLRGGSEVLCGGERRNGWHRFAIKPDTTWRIFRIQYCPWRVGKCITWLWRCKMAQDDRTMITKRSKNDDVDFWVMNPAFIPLSGHRASKGKETPFPEFSCLIKPFYLLSRSAVVGKGYGLGVVSKERVLEKQMFPRLEENSAAPYWTQWHITLLTTDCPLSLSCARWIQAKTSNSVLYIVSFNIILQVVSLIQISLPKLL
jgi:hypothetical protein